MLNLFEETILLVIFSKYITESVERKIVRNGHSQPGEIWTHFVEMNKSWNIWSVKATKIGRLQAGWMVDLWPGAF